VIVKLGKPSNASGKNTVTLLLRGDIVLNAIVLVGCLIFFVLKWNRYDLE